MWIEKLNDIFEEFRKYKGYSINPELNSLRDGLSAWINFIIEERSKFILEPGKKAKNSEISITEIEGFDLNSFKHHLNIMIKTWLEDKPPYEIINTDGKKVPEYKPYAECKNNDERFKVVLDFFDRIIKVHKIKVRLEVNNE